VNAAEMAIWNGTQRLEARARDLELQIYAIADSSQAADKAKELRQVKAELSSLHELLRSNSALEQAHEIDSESGVSLYIIN
jgi:hypothetical protein